MPPTTTAAMAGSDDFANLVSHRPADHDDPGADHQDDHRHGSHAQSQRNGLPNRAAFAYAIDAIRACRNAFT